LKNKGGAVVLGDPMMILVQRPIPIAMMVDGEEDTMVSLLPLSPLLMRRSKIANISSNALYYMRSYNYRSF